MIEKIGMEAYRAISKPSEHVFFVIDNLLRRKGLHIAEIGVGIGATALEIVKRLSHEDSYYIFDFENNVEELYEDIKSAKCTVNRFGNTTKLWDSYSWNLANFYLNDAGEKSLFDLAYLDGAHTFFHDAPACCVLKELVKVDGYLILDDVSWTYAKSPTLNPIKNPSALDKMTIDQINIPHIDLIIRLFLDTDKRFIRVKDNSLSDWRAIFKKVMDF